MTKCVKYYRGPLFQKLRNSDNDFDTHSIVYGVLQYHDVWTTISQLQSLDASVVASCRCVWWCADVDCSLSATQCGPDFDAT